MNDDNREAPRMYGTSEGFDLDDGKGLRPYPTNTTEVFRHKNLVLTVSHDHEGYELLVEVDTDESAAGVSVKVSTATDDVADLTL